MIRKNIFFTIMLVATLAILTVMIVSGWSGWSTFMGHLILLAVFGGMLTWDIYDRPKTDPIRKLFRKAWDAFWNKFC